MYEYAGIYEAIIEATTSEIILFFIIVAVVMAAVVAPVYIAMLRDRKAARLHDKEREAQRQLYDQEREERVRLHERESKQQIIEVVKENSAVIASLKTTLENSGASTVKALERIHTRLDDQGAILKTVAADIAKINTKFDNSLENQREMASKINKIFVTTSGGNLPPDSGAGKQGGTI